MYYRRLKEEKTDLKKALAKAALEGVGLKKVWACEPEVPADEGIEEAGGRVVETSGLPIQEALPRFNPDNIRESPFELVV